MKWEVRNKFKDGEHWKRYHVTDEEGRVIAIIDGLLCGNDNAEYYANLIAQAPRLEK